MRKLLTSLLLALGLGFGQAEALTVRDVIELSKAGLNEEVLLALIEVERQVFSLDVAQITALKDAGLSDRVIVAIIRSGRTAPTSPTLEATTSVEPARAPVPQVVVIDHREPAPSPVLVQVPVFIPVAVPAVTRRRLAVPIPGRTDFGRFINDGFGRFINDGTRLVQTTEVEPRAGPNKNEP